MPELNLFQLLGLTSTEKQTPQIVENIENTKQRMEWLESGGLLRRQTLLTPLHGFAASATHWPTKESSYI